MNDLQIHPLRCSSPAYFPILYMLSFLLQTLEDQRKMIKAGKLVKDEDIPGPITMMVPQSASAENNQCGSAGVAGDEVNNVSAGTTRTVPSSASGSEHSPTADMLQASSANPAQSSGGQQQSSVDQTPQGAIKRNQRGSLIFDLFKSGVKTVCQCTSDD